MKKISILFMTLFSLGLFAQTGTIQYLEGTVDIRKGGAEMTPAEIGMSIVQGDTVITGLDGFCEVDLQGGSSMNIDPDTVFSFQKASVAPDREPESIFRVAIGKISFKFNQFLGKEPAIASPGTVCGIRGTEFTVVAAADGQSLYVVSEGEVAVESAGQLVSLTTDEGVEASAQGIGEKFPVLQGSMDFSNWRDEADKKAEDFPDMAMDEMLSLLESYLSDAEYYYDLYVEYKKTNDELLDKIRTLRSEGKEDEAQKVSENEFLPINRQLLTIIVNYRYYAISILSIRQHVVSQIYVKQRTKSWESEIHEGFKEKYDRFMEIYEDRVIDYFDPEDI